VDLLLAEHGDYPLTDSLTVAARFGRGSVWSRFGWHPLNP
jgi:hypothetical protein